MEQQENWETGARSAWERPLAQIDDVEVLNEWRKDPANWKK